MGTTCWWPAVGVLHRDIKPAIFLSTRSQPARPKLLRLPGLAKVLPEDSGRARSRSAADKAGTLPNVFWQLRRATDQTDICWLGRHALYEAVHPDNRPAKGQVSRCSPPCANRRWCSRVTQSPHPRLPPEQECPCSCHLNQQASQRPSAAELHRPCAISGQSAGTAVTRIGNHRRSSQRDGRVAGTRRTANASSRCFAQSTRQPSQTAEATIDKTEPSLTKRKGVHAHEIETTSKHGHCGDRRRPAVSLEA